MKNEKVYSILGDNDFSLGLYLMVKYLVIPGTIFISSILYSGAGFENYNNTKKSIRESDKEENTINKIVSENYQLFKTKDELKEIEHTWPPVNNKELWNTLPSPGDTGTITRINMHSGHMWKEKVFVDSDSNIYIQEEPFILTKRYETFKYVRKIAYKKMIGRKFED